ncbi:MAG: hypothetical protein AAF383_25570 [Cyanobacteria bacterium P01_A01_bin.83]
MIELSQKIPTINWLQNRLISHKNGVIFDDESYRCFNLLQDFIEANDHHFKTPVIYYQAFPEESAAEFIATLREEVTAKLGKPETYLNKSLLEIITDVGLKMVIIDQCHLHPLDTLDSLLKQLQSCNVCLVLVGAYQKMELSQILSHPCVALWEQFTVDNQCQCLTQVS